MRVGKKQENPVHSPGNTDYKFFFPFLQSVSQSL